jgi:hypothetical protein
VSYAAVAFRRFAESFRKRGEFRSAGVGVEAELGAGLADGGGGVAEGRVGT